MDQDKIKNVTQDVDGKESSKRKYGMRLLNIGIGMGVLFFLIGLGMALFGKQLVYQFPLEIWWTFMGSGASLLGITLVERFSKRRE